MDEHGNGPFPLLVIGHRIMCLAENDAWARAKAGWRAGSLLYEVGSPAISESKKNVRKMSGKKKAIGDLHRHPLITSPRKVASGKRELDIAGWNHLLAFS